MTAIYLPETIQIAQILPSLSKKNIVFAGGIHKEIATKYIRFGHMGVSIVSASPAPYHSSYTCPPELTVAAGARERPR